MRWFILFFLVGLAGLLAIGIPTHWAVKGMSETLAQWTTFGFIASGGLMILGACGIAGKAGYDIHP